MVFLKVIAEETFDLYDLHQKTFLESLQGVGWNRTFPSTLRSVKIIVTDFMRLELFFCYFLHSLIRFCSYAGQNSLAGSNQHENNSKIGLCLAWPQQEQTGFAVLDLWLIPEAPVQVSVCCKWKPGRPEAWPRVQSPGPLPILAAAWMWPWACCLSTDLTSTVLNSNLGMIIIIIISAFDFLECLK